MGNKNPQNVPFPLHDVNVHLIGLPYSNTHASAHRTHHPKRAAATVEALSYTYAVKSPLVTMTRPQFAPKSTPSCGAIPKPHYLPHPWTRPTYDAKRHPDPIRRFSTMHWTARRAACIFMNAY